MEERNRLVTEACQIVLAGLDGNPNQEIVR